MPFAGLVLNDKLHRVVNQREQHRRADAFGPAVVDVAIDARLAQLAGARRFKIHRDTMWRPDPCPKDGNPDEPWLDGRDPVLAVKMGAPFDQEHAAVIAIEIALYFAADEPGGRTDDLGLQRTGEGGSLGQGETAIAKH